MVDVRGKGTGTLEADDGRRMPFELELTVEVPAGGRVRVLEMTLRPTGQDPITPEVLRIAAEGINEFADYLGARAVRQYQMRHGQASGTHLEGPDALRLAQGSAEARDPDFIWPDSGMILGPRFVKGAQVELQRRRKSKWSDAEYEQAATVYREAVAAGAPAQQAVADRFVISKSRAAAVIGECRARHLLGPARPGRSQTP